MIFTYYFVPDIEMFFLTFQKELMCHELLGCVCVFGFQTEAKKLVFKSFGVVAYFSFSYIYFGKSKRWVKQKVVWVWWFISLFFCWRFFQCYIYIVCNSQWCGPLTYTFDILQNWENSWFESPRMGIYFFVSWRWVQIWWSQFRSIFTGRVFDWFHLEQ